MGSLLQRESQLTHPDVTVRQLYSTSFALTIHYIDFSCIQIALMHTASSLCVPFALEGRNVLTCTLKQGKEINAAGVANLGLQDRSCPFLLLLSLLLTRV